jgi:hypothetical protein
MGPPVRHEAGVLFWRKQRIQPIKFKVGGFRQYEPGCTCDCRARKHTHQQYADRAKQVWRAQWNSASSAGGDCQQHSQKCANPPGREDSPLQREKCGRFQGKNRWVEDGKILDADPHGDLIVHNAVADCRSDAKKPDLQNFHDYPASSRSAPRNSALRARITHRVRITTMMTKNVASAPAT